MTASIVDDLTDTPSNKNRECVGQGVANIATGFIGGMAGCAMIGQSVINVKSGGRGRLSTLRGRRVPADPGGVPRAVGQPDPDGGAGGGDDHGQHRHLQLGLDPQAARAPAELVDRHDRHRRRHRGHARPGQGRVRRRAAVGLFFAHKVGRVLRVDRSSRRRRAACAPTAWSGQVFFASAETLHRRLRLQGGGRTRCCIDVSRAHFWDITAVSALDKVVLKFRREGAEVEVLGLNEASATLVDRFARARQARRRRTTDALKETAMNKVYACIDGLANTACGDRLGRVGVAAAGAAAGVPACAGTPPRTCRRPGTTAAPSAWMRRSRYCRR